MTTIAYRDGVLAVDSMCSNNGWKNFLPTKKIIHKCGRLFVICGEIASSIKAIDDIITTENSSSGMIFDLGDHSTILELTTIGSIKIYEDKHYFSIERESDFISLGSGSPAAMGAMYAGASSYEAIAIASQLDTCTGGVIRCIRVEGNDFRVAYYIYQSKDKSIRGKLTPFQRLIGYQ